MCMTVRPSNELDRYTTTVQAIRKTMSRRLLDKLLSVADNEHNNTGNTLINFAMNFLEPGSQTGYHGNNKESSLMELCSQEIVDELPRSLVFIS